MYKSLFMVLVALLLSAGVGLAEEMPVDEPVDDIVDETVNETEDETEEVSTVTFTGIAMELFAPAEGVVGAPFIWEVNVTSAEEGALCSDVVNVTVYQSTQGPWGVFDANVTVGDEVEVFGAYIADETGCSVTLNGSLDYYFMLASEEVVEDEVVEDEVVEDEVVEETNETTGETTE